MQLGESPIECAKREALEEVGLTLTDDDLRLFGYVSEKNYEGNAHWLMFLVDILPVVKSLPPKIEEGYFEFFYRKQINDIKIPPTDHQLVWPFFDKRKQGFWGIRADFEKKSPKIKIEAKPF